MKVTKKELKSMDNINLLITFDKLVTKLTNEVNSIRGETKETILSYEYCKNELLERLGEKSYYDSDYNIIEKN